MSIQRVSVREARQHLPRLLDQVKAGNEVLVLRRGVEIARLVRPATESAALPGLAEFRASVKVKGQALSREIQKTRRSSRY